MHLAGPEGLLKMLEKKGYKVKQYKIRKNNKRKDCRTKNRHTKRIKKQHTTAVLVAQLKNSKFIFVKSGIFCKFIHARKEEFYSKIICFG